MHRGSVRLQIKVFQPEGDDRDDVKVCIVCVRVLSFFLPTFLQHLIIPAFSYVQVHFLSYVMWLFGIGDFAAAELNKWPVRFWVTVWGALSGLN